MTAQQAELLTYLHQVREVYAAIARKIEDLLFLLNETGASHDHHIQELSTRITSFLASFKQNVAQEEILARKMPLGKKKHFLVLLQRELQTIGQLNAYVILSKRKPIPAVITKINELQRVVEREIEQQEALAA